MGGYAPHLGLVVTKGAVKSYEIWERGNDKANSHTRGIIALNLPDIQLEPGKEYSISWRLFSHKGIDDFQQKVLEKEVCSCLVINMFLKKEKQPE